jgi:hypothetical protein
MTKDTPKRTASDRPQRLEPLKSGQAPQTEFDLYMQAANIYPRITSIPIDESLAEFYQIRKHFLICTDAGKPIYSKHGDETVLAPFFATISAVMPKIQSYFWDPSVHAKENKNKLHMVQAHGFTVCFLKKGSLIYICLYNTAQKTSDGKIFLDELEAYEKADEWAEQSEAAYLRTLE